MGNFITLAVLHGVGLYLTIKFNFVQFGGFRHSVALIREIDEKGDVAAGPMYTLLNGLNMKRTTIFFAFFCHGCLIWYWQSGAG